VDNTQAWEMNGEGHYRRKTSRGAKTRSAQLALMNELTEQS
jgi:polyphosphate kinase